MLHLFLFCAFILSNKAQYPTPVFANWWDRYDATSYSRLVKFQCWNGNILNTWTSPLDEDLTTKGCPTSGNFAFVFPGWNSGYTYEPIQQIISSLLQYRTGCVCAVDYRAYSNNPDQVKFNYPALVAKDYLKIAQIATTKVHQVGNYSRMMFYGHSLGSRMAIEVGAVGTNGQISMLDLCEVAAPNFDIAPLGPVRNPKTAGKNVQCIHTSAALGTIVTNCHQNWRMGPGCGWWQTNNTVTDHSLCHDFYNAAFTRKFVPNQSCLNGLCFSHRPANITAPACAGAKMGYFRTYDTTNCVGDLFASANSTAPYTNLV